MTSRSEKAKRLRQANALIEAISRHGRQFFRHEDRVSRFELSLDGRLWLRDKYTWQRCLTSCRWNWRAFSDGGTLRRLIEDLSDYIRTGRQISRGHFGPWPSWRNDGDLWGYGREAMDALRSEIAGNPCLRPLQVKEAV